MGPVRQAFAHHHAEQLYEKISTREIRVGVVGLGYVGLPLAVELARAGFQVLGMDLDERKCRSIRNGLSYIRDIPSSVIADLVKIGQLTATDKMGELDKLDIVHICVPTPLCKTGDPDLSHVVAVVQSLKEYLQPGMLIILESTTYPGTTEEVVQVILEETGLTAGSDFFLAYSPERVDPGNQQWRGVNIPKVVGGVTPDSSSLAAALYECFIEHVVRVSSPRAAEMVKLLENSFRAVNIGFINEMALMCERLDVSVWEVIEAAATKPFGFMPFYPGPGLGGHCIPIDPLYLSWKVRESGFDARFIDLARVVNEAMPHHVVDKIGDALNSHGKPLAGSNILILGVAYKRDVEDCRESPAFDVMALLLKKGAIVAYHDPFVPNITHGDWPGGNGPVSTCYSTDALKCADCVVILTDHSAFDYGEIVSSARLVIDTRNAIKPSVPNVFKLGSPNPTGRD